MGNQTPNPRSGFSTNDIPDLSGKVILVTGGTAGLGKATILELSKHAPTQILFTGRNQKSASSVIDEIKTLVPTANPVFIECDLAFLSSVQSCAKAILARVERLDIVILNAGIMALPPGLTKDGYELQFGTNHLGHALLLKLLLPVLEKTAHGGGKDGGKGDVRVVSITTGFQNAAMVKIDFDKKKTTQDEWLMGPWVRYMQSKLANVFYAKELARRYKDTGIIFVSVWPGVINTGLVTNLSLANRLFIKATTTAIPTEEGILNQIWAATGERKDIVNGMYYMYPKVLNEPLNKDKFDPLAAELWGWTEGELGGWKL